eukprot:TRINITY_DN58052_c0_g2_i1.p2 TRINITY_DN58052_c0_g2~~TRINITY_DN58052_c0_g2_i1.p2  ORF type:complete len:106 (-),score=18.32 TRINITY_DN58052_c0_g2_i1:11-328(-)
MRCIEGDRAYASRVAANSAKSHAHATAAACDGRSEYGRPLGGIRIAAIGRCNPIALSVPVDQTGTAPVTERGEVELGPRDATPGREIGRAVQQECRDRSRMPSSA